MANIELTNKDQRAELEDFLVSVSDEKYRPMAREYLDWSFSDRYKKPCFFVTKEEGRIVGAAAISEEIFTVDIWGISWVGVDPDKRNQGIGEELVLKCLDEIKNRAQKAVTVLLNTYPGKTGLYEKVGFISAGSDHEGGCLMIKHLG